MILYQWLIVKFFVINCKNVQIFNLFFFFVTEEREFEELQLTEEQKERKKDPILKGMRHTVNENMKKKQLNKKKWSTKRQEYYEPSNDINFIKNARRSNFKGRHWSKDEEMLLARTARLVHYNLKHSKDESLTRIKLCDTTFWTRVKEKGSFDRTVNALECRGRKILSSKGVNPKAVAILAFVQNERRDCVNPTSVSSS